jgi:hypothetical protein
MKRRGDYAPAMYCPTFLRMQIGTVLDIEETSMLGICRYYIQLRRLRDMPLIAVRG